MSRCEAAARRALIYLGPPHDLGGVVHVLKIEPGLSTFGAPTPEALEQCVPGVGRYARKMPIPYTLDELLQELPGGLSEAARHSNCVKYAFYTSRVDPRQLKPGVYATTDPVLYHNLTRYASPTGKIQCGGRPEARELWLRVMDPLEFLDFLYHAELSKTFRYFLWRLPQILARRRK